jgi:hypothetical protein
VDHLTVPVSEETISGGDGFLAHGKHFAKVGLGFFEVGLPGFARGEIIFEGGFQFCFRGLSVDGFLQGLGFRAWRAELATASSALIALGIIAAAIASAEHSPASIGESCHLRVGHGLDERLDGLPFSVVCDFKLVFEAIYPSLLPLLYLGRVGRTPSARAALGRGIVLSQEATCGTKSYDACYY